MKKSNGKKSINITRRIDRAAAPIDPAMRAELMKAPKLKYPPKDIDEQNKLADELVAWCMLSDSLTINGFPISKGYNPYRFFRAAIDNEYFANAVGLAKAIIVDRLEVGLHHGKYDRSLFLARLPLYDQAHRAMQLEDIQLSRQPDPAKSAENFRIEMTPSESSDLVPLKDNNEMD